jgi:hypothetical protein
LGCGFKLKDVVDVATGSHTLSRHGACDSHCHTLDILDSVKKPEALRRIAGAEVAHGYPVAVVIRTLRAPHRPDVEQAWQEAGGKFFSRQDSRNAVTYTKEMIPELLQTFMAGSTPNAIHGCPGNKYFECSVIGFGPPSSQPRPYTYKQLQDADSFVMTYKLINSTGFYNDLQTNYAINSNWVTFGNTVGPTNIGRCEKGETCVVTDYRYVNIPMSVPSSEITIPNPKDVIASALPTIGTLQNTILAREMDVNLGQWN